jgi:hypothetical protein
MDASAYTSQYLTTDSQIFSKAGRQGSEGRAKLVPHKEIGLTDGSGSRFAVVVPDGAVRAAVRVPARVRDALDINVHEADGGGCVRKIED